VLTFLGYQVFGTSTLAFAVPVASDDLVFSATVVEIV